MQKKLIALAIAGLASTAAFAQTNVTLYGVADVTLESVKADGDTTGSANYGNTARINSNSSYVGLKGTEDLGNGLNALFQFETGFNADTGVYSGSGRDTFVGLGGDFGKVVLGNLTTPTRALGNRMEMLPGNTGVGDAVSLLGNTLNLGNTGTTGTFDTRMANTIAYTSNNYSGFSFAGDVSLGENKTLDNAATALNTKTYEIGLNYATGGWDLGYVYGHQDTGSTASSGIDVIKNHRLGVGYAFDGGHRVTFQWNKQTIDLLGSNGDLDENSYSLQGEFMVTPNGGIIADYTVARDLTGSATGGGASDTGAKLYTIGWLQNLSKRTMVKVLYTRINNDTNANYNFSSGAVGSVNSAASVLAGTNTAGFGPGANPSAFAVGIRHSF